MTKQREQVLKIIQSAEQHPSVEEIYMQLKKQNVRMVYATVYNSLNYLVEHHYIRRIHIPGQADRYDWNLQPHDHFICKRCGMIADVPSNESVEQFVDFNGNRIEGYEIIYHGLCRQCLDKSIRINKNDA